MTCGSNTSQVTGNYTATCSTTGSLTLWLPSGDSATETGSWVNIAGGGTITENNNSHVVEIGSNETIGCYGNACVSEFPGDSSITLWLQPNASATVIGQNEGIISNSCTNITEASNSSAVLLGSWNTMQCGPNSSITEFPGSISNNLYLGTNDWAAVTGGTLHLSPYDNITVANNSTVSVDNWAPTDTIDFGANDTLYLPGQYGGYAFHVPSGLSGVVVDSEWDFMLQYYFLGNTNVIYAGDFYDDYIDWLFYGWDDFGGYYGGYYGLTSKSSGAKILQGQNIGAIASHNLNDGDIHAASVAERALQQIKLLATMSPQSPGEGSAVLESAKWDSQVITWCLADSAGTSSSPFSNYMDKSEETLVKKAFATWAPASGLKFKEVSDSAKADIRIGWGSFDTNDTGIIGYTSFKRQSGEFQPGAIIRLEDPTEDALITDSSGTQTYAGTDTTLLQALLHEIGHALGLNCNADPNSVMYYDLTSQNRTLDATDIAGIQLIYGQNGDKASQSRMARTNQLIQAMAGFGIPGSAQFNPLPVNTNNIMDASSLLATSHQN